MAKKDFLLPIAAVFAVLAQDAKASLVKPSESGAVQDRISSAINTVALPAEYSQFPALGESKKVTIQGSEGFFKFIITRSAKGQLFAQEHDSHASHDSHDSHSSHSSHTSGDNRI